MKKKIVRLAVVRKDDADPCPFGLSIPFGCKYAGEFIDKMAPLKILGDDATQEEKDKIIKANKKLLTWRLVESTERPKQCKYASSLMPEHDAVDCTYEDVAPGVNSAPFVGSPFYSRVMSGNGIEGLYSYPIGNYADFNISRNLFYGIYSIQGSNAPELVKLAKEEKDTADGACILFYCPDDSTVLLLKRSDSVNSPGTWGLPGGHMEKGEFPAQCAVREMQEEMGFVPGVNDVISSGYIERDEDSKSIIFIVAIKQQFKDKCEENISLNEEHDEYKWFKTHEIPENLHPVADFVLNEPANNNEY